MSNINLIIEERAANIGKFLVENRFPKKELLTGILLQQVNHLLTKPNRNGKLKHFLK